MISSRSLRLRGHSETELFAVLIRSWAKIPSITLQCYDFEAGAAAASHCRGGFVEVKKPVSESRSLMPPLQITWNALTAPGGPVTSRFLSYEFVPGNIAKFTGTGLEFLSQDSFAYLQTVTDVKAGVLKFKPQRKSYLHPFIRK